MLAPGKRVSYTIVAAEEGGDQSDYANGSNEDDAISTTMGQPGERANSRTRICADRIKVLIALGAFIVLIFASAMLGVGVQQYKEKASYKNRTIVAFALFKTVTALMEEAAYSVAFTDPSVSIASNADDMTDRERAEGLITLQRATRQSFRNIVAMRHKHCTNSQPVLSMYNFADLLTIQDKVQLRVLSPEDVYAYYSDGVNRLVGILASFVGWGTDPAASSSAWMEQLILANRAIASAATCWQTAYLKQSLTADKSYQYMATSLDAVSMILAMSPLVIENDPTNLGILSSKYRVERVLSPFTNDLRKTLSGAHGDFTNLRSEGAHTPEEAVALTISVLRRVITAVEATSPENEVRMAEWRWVIGLSCALIVVSAVVTVVALREATVLVWAADAHLAEMKATQRLQASLLRMHGLIDAMHSLDREGIACAKARSTAAGANATNAERELMQLAAPAHQVLSFVNPCVLDRCVAAYNAYGAVAPPANDAYGTTVKDPVIMGLGLQYMSLILVDLRSFANVDITADTCRTLPKDLLVFLNAISALATQCGGTIVGISGTVLTIAWNVRANGGRASGSKTSSGERAQWDHPRAVAAAAHAMQMGGGSDTSETPENDACQVLLHFRLTKLAQKYPKVRFSVVSGVCTQGVIGSPTMRSYVVTGNLVMLGRVLLEGARFHDVANVTDTTTFLKLDTLQFRKRALEAFGVYPTESKDDGTPRKGATKKLKTNYTAASDNETVFYEVTIAGVEPSQYTVLWNAGFDDYTSNKAEESTRKAMAWAKLFGERRTLMRVMALLGEGGGGRTAYYYRGASVNSFEYNFVI